MASCGIWRGHDQLTAVVVDGGPQPAGPVFFITRPTEEDRWRMLSYIEQHYGLDCGFVFAAGLAKRDAIATFAVHKRAPAWTVDDKIIEGFLFVWGVSRIKPEKLALLLARLGENKALRTHLHPLHLQLNLPLVARCRTNSHFARSSRAL